MKKFNVIVENINRRAFTSYDVIPYLVKQYHKSKNKPKTLDEFKKFILGESMYQWWSRCEYEIVLETWPTSDVNKKIDVHWQVQMNIDIISEIVMDECLNK